MTPNTHVVRYVAYYRVSTQKQGESGLGLEAQQTAVKRHLQANPGELLAEFTETESGKQARNRPSLLQALELCRRRHATLIIAKLDRLARNVHFISGLLESGVHFIASDQPTKDRFMLHVQAAFAEEEARRISIRTREALAAAKRRGVVIGETGRALARRHQEAAQCRAHSYQDIIIEALRAGAKTTRQVRDYLNDQRLSGPGGGRRHLSNTYHTLQRLGGTKALLCSAQTSSVS
jgi:DNA invertase Pin-like site-specific DNA recombinase